MSENKSGSGGGGGCGCLGIIVFCLLVWALVFGVTVDGRHYGIGCTCAEGVTVTGDTDAGPVSP